MNVTLACDRCGKTVKGAKYTDARGHVVTAGFYLLDGAWSFAARKGEVAICDACMWADPKYREQYPELNDA